MQKFQCPIERHWLFNWIPLGVLRSAGCPGLLVTVVPLGEMSRSAKQLPPLFSLLLTRPCAFPGIALLHKFLFFVFYVWGPHCGPFIFACSMDRVAASKNLGGARIFSVCFRHASFFSQWATSRMQRILMRQHHEFSERHMGLRQWKPSTIAHLSLYVSCCNGRYRLSGTCSANYSRS